MKADQIVKYEKVTKKSRAGVKYIHYVPYLEGTGPQGLNRASRRRVFQQMARNYKGKGWLGTGRKFQSYER